MQREYLGDGVYAVLDQFGSLVLTTEDGLRATNRIVLEPEVLSALLAYVGRLRPPLARCSGCGCPVVNHRVDGEERRDCRECECKQYEVGP